MIACVTGCPPPPICREPATQARLMKTGLKMFRCQHCLMLSTMLFNIVNCEIKDVGVLCIAGANLQPAE